MFKILTKKEYNELLNAIETLNERQKLLSKKLEEATQKPKYFGGN